MRELIAISLLMVGLLLFAGCTEKGTGTGGTTPAGGTGGTVQPSGGTGTTGYAVKDPTLDSATSSDFDNPVENLTEPSVDATEEEFEMPA
jgi:hypothetical protein